MLTVKPIGISGAYPHPTPCSCYLVSIDGEYLVLDLGSGSLFKLLKDYSLENLKTFIISHFHHDHSSDLGSLLYTRILHPKLSPLKLFTPYHDPLLKELERREGVEHEVIEEDSEIEFMGAKISFFKQVHPVECYAIKVAYQGKTLIYGADGAYSEGFSSFIKDCDLLIVEYSLFKYPVGDSGHMNEESIIRLLKEANPKRTLLTHLWRNDSKEELLEAIKEKVTSKVEIINTEKVYEL